MGATSCFLGTCNLVALVEYGGGFTDTEERKSVLQVFLQLRACDFWRATTNRLYPDASVMVGEVYVGTTTNAESSAGSSTTGGRLTMALFNLPDPVSMYENAKNSGLERKEIDALVSAAYSAAISFMWASGDSKWAVWTGEAQGLKDAATAMYLTLSKEETKNFLTLTVPQKLLDANNLSRFQTEWKSK